MHKLHLIAAASGLALLLPVAGLTQSTDALRQRRRHASTCPTNVAHRANAGTVNSS
ncbi:MAG: hypothetical protein KC572_05395 [Gammaproteobacteria bacterium]|nr:hypothetical protein [Gammaproteobacteria bacterium]